MYSQKEAERVINEIKHFEKDIKPVVKAKILELARIYEEAIEEKNQLVLVKIKNIKERNKNEEPSVKDIALLINKLREENFKTMTDKQDETNSLLKNLKLAFTVETHHATRYR